MLELRLAGSELHSQFVQWLAAVDATVPRTDDLELLPSARFDGLRPVLRLNTFASSGIYFDHAGSSVGEPAAGGSCACVLELAGTWAAQDREGVRWRVVQCKSYADPVRGDEFAFLSEDEEM